ncbi:AAA family ATPase [Cellulomonas sp. C5510]|uniref:AAA family ATPase n=1 Tax=Cellulomonas sp. C5510 TaxID=2871170 RepID=UPI001C94F76F|nr:AAA family ATPase [Cellulomonas sp. C5510]QZN85756.1 AAA family ATPase [Cellulomonas sp. C5510]
MRLHTLTLQAVGPFAGRHTVDFAALSAGGLFLLEGPTGAGKSTVIDAVVFALYGKVASAAASEDRLRSAFAGEDVETVVDLVLETGAGVYRVRRTPAYDRPKRRGSGTVRQQATVKLWRLTAVPASGEPDDADGELLSTRLDEAGAELTRVVGLDRAQFVQTMVLPQGEFAAFLRADPEQRRGLLQRIFGTEVYDRLQQRLQELGREASRAVAEARGRVQECAARFAGASGADDDGVAELRDAATEDPSTVAALVEERLGVLRAEAAAAEESARAAARRAATVRAATDEAGRRLRLVRRRTSLVVERERLAAAADQHAADLRRLDRARRAAVVRPALRGLDEARAASAGAEKELRAALDAAPGGLAPADTDAALADATLPDSLAAERDAGAALVATLRRVVALEDGLPARRRELDRLRDRQTARARAIADADEVLAARPTERQALLAELDDATGLAATEPARARDVADAEALLAAVRDLRAAEGELAEATRQRAGAAAVAGVAVQEEARLRTARLEGFAGELAAGLTDGEPCPVCGAAEHPRPAPLGADHVREEDVAAAEERRRAAEADVRERDAAVVALTERCAALRERVGATTSRRDDTEPESAVQDSAVRDDAARDGVAQGGSVRDVAALQRHAEDEVGHRRTLLAEARAAAGTRDRLRDAVADHDRVTEELRAGRSRLADELAEAAHALTRAQEELDRDAAEVAEARAGHSTVVARQGAEQARVDAADAVRDALARHAQAGRVAADREAELRLLLVEHGFAAGAEEDAGTTAEDAARAAVAASGDVAAVERAVEAHRTAVALVEEGLRDPELADLGDEGPDALAIRLAELESALAEATATADAAGAAHGSVRDRLGRAADAARHVVEGVSGLSAAERDAGPVLRMARLAGGTDADNAAALSLATYVLVRRFEDVVAAANERLREMSDGRYELERSDEREDVRSRRTGLAMRVLDHTTGSARDPRTLSGGETFYVSLCLALGMADVVMAEAGGVELGTLFIDEGFGTLDPHTLDAVLAELGRLRAGGRVVGVVSHVETLKQAVAERIEVRRRPDGSSTLTVVAG